MIHTGPLRIKIMLYSHDNASVVNTQQYNKIEKNSNICSTHKIVKTIYHNKRFLRTLDYLFEKFGRSLTFDQSIDIY